MSRAGIEPRSSGPLANTLLIRPMAGSDRYVFNDAKENNNVCISCSREYPKMVMGIYKLHLFAIGRI